LGIAESIAGVIVIGFAIDYVLHMTHVYGEAGESGIQERQARTRFFDFVFKKFFSGGDRFLGVGIVY